MVTRTVKALSHARLLTLLCLQCSDPLTVRARSELATMRPWSMGEFPLEARAANVPWEECHAAAAQARQRAERLTAEERRQEAERAEAERRAADQAKVDNAGQWLADHRSRAEPAELPEQAADALALLTMIEIMARAWQPLRVASPLRWCCA